jgi:hypothetical protein
LTVRYVKEIMKYIYLYALFVVVVFLSCCGQSQTTSPKENSKAETKVIVTSPGFNEKDIHTMYEYNDSNGARLIIQNGLPRGGMKYTDPNGEVYVYAVFWTRIINETDNPLELTTDFSLDSFEIPSSSGNYMKLFLPSDTMTIDKAPLYEYGLTIKTFLDNNRHKSSSLKRTINQKSSSAFYVVTLSDRGVGGTLRTGLSIKEQNLFYRINDKEIPCGKINFKKMMLQK